MVLFQVRPDLHVTRDRGRRIFVHRVGVGRLAHVDLHSETVGMRESSFESILLIWLIFLQERLPSGGGAGPVPAAVGGVAGHRGAHSPWPRVVPAYSPPYSECSWQP